LRKQREVLKRVRKREVEEIEMGEKSLGRPTKN